MLGKFALLFSFAGLVLVAAMTISCGSSSSSGTKPCTGGPFNVVGDWQITVSTSAGSVSGFGAIDSTGLALFFDNTAPLSTGDTLQLPHLTGACSFSGNLTAYSEPGGPSSGVVETDVVQGNVTSATAISGSLTGSPTGTISLVPSTPLTGSVTALNGTMIGEAPGAINLQGLLLSLTVSPSGSNNSMSFTTSNLAGCEANGTFTEAGTNNVFDVSITFQPGCPLSGTFSGIGFESSTDYFGFSGAVGTYLYADILASTNTFVLEIYPLCGECRGADTRPRNTGADGLDHPGAD